MYSVTLTETPCSATEVARTKVGDIEGSVLSANFYCTHSLMCGDVLSTKETECSAFAVRLVSTQYSTNHSLEHSTSPTACSQTNLQL
eukprot:scaffold14104_cov200-Alexandrium_tamarense.AAC.2